MKQILKIGIIALIAVLAGAFALNRFQRYHHSRIDQVKELERRYWQEQTDQLEGQLARLEEEIEKLQVSEQTRTKVTEVFKEEPLKLMFAEGELTLEKTVFQLVTFFAYLDQQEYVKAHAPGGGSHQIFRQALDKLLQHPPMYNEELANLDNLNRNLSHFEAVLGKDAVRFFSDVFNNETELLEPLLNAYDSWSQLCESHSNSVLTCPRLPQLYDYASFFLGTFAGRNYLFESNPKLRVLLTYYSVLILDRAIDEQLNPNGLDIRQHILSALRAVDLQKDLVGMEVYQSKLKLLARKYRLI